jgi:hypothetical protein
MNLLRHEVDLIWEMGMGMGSDVEPPENPTTLFTGRTTNTGIPAIFGVSHSHDPDREFLAV